MSSSEDSLRKLLHKVSQKNVDKIVEASGEQGGASKQESEDAILDAAYDQGIQEFVQMLTQKEVQIMLNDLGKDTKDLARKDLEERLFTEFENLGLDELFTKLSTTTLTDLGKRIGFDADSTNSKVEIALANQVMLLGTKKVFSKIHVQGLKAIAKDLGVSSAGKNKEELEAAVLGYSFDTEASSIVKTSTKKGTKKAATTKRAASTKKSTRSASTKKTRAASTTKKSTTKKAKTAAKPKVKYPTKEEILEMRKDHPIEKGISRRELNDYYWIGELKDYCKNNGLKVSGKKSDLQSRIVKFLDTGVVEESKKRKRGTSTKKTSNKKQKTEDNGDDNKEGETA